MFHQHSPVGVGTDFLNPASQTESVYGRLIDQGSGCLLVSMDEVLHAHFKALKKKDLFIFTQVN